MSHVQGAVVVRRPELVELPGMLAPANSLDFVKTLESYFPIFKGSLFPIRYGGEPGHQIYKEVAFDTTTTYYHGTPNMKSIHCCDTPMRQ